MAGRSTRKPTWKWTREATGVYRSGAYRIEGSGTHWMLFHLTEEQTYCIGTGSRKKDLQLRAEDLPVESTPDSGLDDARADFRWTREDCERVKQRIRDALEGCHYGLGSSGQDIDVEMLRHTMDFDETEHRVHVRPCPPPLDDRPDYEPYMIVERERVGLTVCTLNQLPTVLRAMGCY